MCLLDKTATAATVHGMPRIGSLVEQRRRRLLRKAEIPTWWPLMLKFMTVCVLAWVAWGLISPSNDTPVAEDITPIAPVATIPLATASTPTTGDTTDGGPVVTSPEATPSSTLASATTVPPTPTSALDGLADETVYSLSGASITIPGGVAQAARTHVASIVPSGTVDEIVVRAIQNADTYLLDVLTDPDGPAGPMAPYTLYLRIYQEGGRWVGATL